MAGEYWPQYGYPNVAATNAPFLFLSPAPVYQSDAWRVDALEKKVARLERQVRRLRLERVRRMRSRRQEK